LALKLIILFIVINDGMCAEMIMTRDKHQCVQISVRLS